MKKFLRLLLVVVSVFAMTYLSPVSGQAPPPPAHGQNGNQTSPGGTGCPIDRTTGIALSLLLCLGYAGFALYSRGKQKESVQ
jgi:hypothetical protein